MARTELFERYYLRYDGWFRRDRFVLALGIRFGLDPSLTRNPFYRYSNEIKSKEPVREGYGQGPFVVVGGIK